MRPFRFRAESALDLRKKHEDDARQVLARAQNVAAMADAKLEDARAQVTRASVELVTVQTQGAPAWLINWHRSWILKRSRDADACQQQAVTAHGVVTQATLLLREAHKKRRVLERLRDRLATRHARAVERHELAEMNELATMRFLVTQREQKEQS